MLDAPEQLRLMLSPKRPNSQLPLPHIRPHHQVKKLTLSSTGFYIRNLVLLLVLKYGFQG